MALIIKDRIKEGTITTGTGDITLAGTAATFKTFSSALSDGDTTYYAIAHTASGVDEWEVGIGTYTVATNSISRDTIIEGSNASSPVNLSAGVKNIFITYPSDKAVYVDTSGAVQPTTTLMNTIKANDGAGSTLDADLLDGQHGSYYTDYVNTAIANLVDTAPATLDTLNELAAALGDDPNFATTVTNSIALKAPLASPAFTGGIDVTGTVVADGLTVQAGVADISVGNVGPSGNAAVNIGRDDTSISTGNPLGYVQFLGSDNTAGSLTAHAYIGAIASASHAAGSNPTELVFGTTAGGSETIVDRMTIDSSGNVGIGTSSPAALLHVAKSADGGVAEIILENSFTNAGSSTDEITQIQGRFGNYDASYIITGKESDFTTAALRKSYLAFSTRTATTGMSEKVRIDSLGNVGIGTSSPTRKLSISSTGQTDLSIRSADNSYAQLLFGDATEDNAGAVSYDNATNTMYFHTVTAGLDGRHMTIDSSGNVGIGTSSPNPTALAILTGGGAKGVLLARNASANPTSGNGLGSFAFKGIMDGTNSIAAAEAAIEAIAVEDHSGSSAATALAFYTKASGTGPGSAPAERLRIDSSGNVGIGTTSITQPSAGATTLKIKGTDNAKAGAIYLESANASVLAYIYPDNASGLSINTSTSHPIVFRTAAAERMRIDSSGEVTLNGTLTTPTATIGGILLEDSTDRTGLLEINRLGTSSYAGIQAKFSATALWSFMGNETTFGLYDDANNDWFLQYTENAGVDLRYNGIVKLVTTDTGVTTTGTHLADTFNATSTAGGGFQGIDADTALIPSFTWTADPDTGMWRTTTNSIGFTTGGVNRITINSAGISGAGVGLTGVLSVGVTQTWKVVTRSVNTNYQNTTGRAIMIGLSLTGASNRVYCGATTSTYVELAFNNAGGSGVNEQYSVTFIVPSTWYWKYTGNKYNATELS